MQLCSVLSWLAACCVLSSTEAARILALLPYSARSHFIVNQPLLDALHSRGHHLTVVSSFPRKTPSANYTDIDLSSKYPAMLSKYSMETIRSKMPDLYRAAMFIAQIHVDVCEDVMTDERVMNLLNEKFDLVIGEIFGSDCFNYLAHKLRAPLVSVVTSTALPWMADRTGLPDNPSYIPNYFLDYSADMTLLERVYNTFTLLVTNNIIYYFWSERPSQAIGEKVFGEELPSLDEINRRTSLVFVNSHFSFSQSRPLPPTVVEVGGIHITEPKPLPKELQEVLDRARHGVVLFSFGSLVRVATLPPAVIRMFLAVFARLPQQVIFKYEEALEDVPPNVLVRPWLPQGDIIAHPNVRAVVTHCGLASTIEAVHYAKAVVAVPFFSDQFLNAKNVVRRGGGFMLDINNLSEEGIGAAINSVVNDPSYAENMRQLSLKFRDRPMTPLDTAVYWTEYVIRHQGAPHLRPASVNLSLHQYLLLDIVGLIFLPGITAICVFLYLSYKCVKGSFRMILNSSLNCLPKQPTKTKTKKKKSKKSD